MSSELDVLQALGAVAEIESMEKTAIVQHLGKVAPFLKGLPGRAAGAVTGWAKGQPGAIREMASEWAAKGGIQRAGGRLAGMGAGAGIGGGIGYATGDTPEERKRRAIGGAIMGGAAGLIPGQFMSRAGRQQAERAAHRQVFGLTGRMPLKVRTGYASQGAASGQYGRLHQAQSLGYDVSPRMQAAISRNIHNIPGFMKGLVTKPVDTLHHGAMGFGRTGAILGGGLTALQVPGALKQTEDSGRAENLGRLAGETIGYLGGSPVPIVGNFALGAGLGEAGGMIGRRFGEITGLGRAAKTSGKDRVRSTSRRAPVSRENHERGLESRRGMTPGQVSSRAVRTAGRHLSPEDIEELRRRSR